MGSTMQLLYQGALDGANLRGLQDTVGDELIIVHCLLGVTMPHGARYDGRYNLPGDVEAHSPDVAARCYRVSVEEYLRGQEWARENLPRLRGRRANV